MPVRAREPEMGDRLRDALPGVSALVFAVIWFHARETAYRCEHCGHEFTVPAWKETISPHLLETKYLRCLRYLLFAISLTLTAFSQQAEKKVKFEIRLEGKAIPAPPPEPEPGDRVEMESATGAIVATSRGRSFIFTRNNFMGPKLLVSYASVGDRVEYVYNLGNAAGSPNAISAFALYLPEPNAVEATTPGSWGHLAILKPAAPEVPSLLFLYTEKDGPDIGRLSAGPQAGPFRVKSQGMPGLVRVVFSPEQEPLKPEGQNSGDFLFGSSPWVRERVLELDTADRHEIRSWTIGPKLGSDGNDLAAIQAEIREGALVPEFARNSVEILAIASLTEPTEIRSRLDRLSGTPFQREWVKALLWRLDRLR